MDSIKKLVELIKKGLEFRGYDSEFIENEDELGRESATVEVYCDGNDENVIWIAGWISIRILPESVMVALYESGYHGMPKEFDRKTLDCSEDAVAYALGKMLEVELRELLY